MPRDRFKYDVKKTLLHAQRGVCAYCGRPLSIHSPKTHLDHVLARACGGSDELKNLVVACERCNTTKAHYSLQRWANKLSERRKNGRGWKHWPKWTDTTRYKAIETARRMSGLPPCHRIVPKRDLQPSKVSTIAKLMAPIYANEAH